MPIVVFSGTYLRISHCPQDADLNSVPPDVLRKSAAEILKEDSTERLAEKRPREFGRRMKNKCSIFRAGVDEFPAAISWSPVHLVPSRIRRSMTGSLRINNSGD